MSYTVTDLGTLGDDALSVASGINALGDVAGYSFTNGSAANAFLYSGGDLTPLGSLGGPVTYANGLNSADEVIGSSSTPDGFTHPFLYCGGTTTDLGTLGGDYGYAFAINEAGQVAGGATTADGATHAFLYTDGAMLDLGTLGGATSIGYGLNSYGQVVGFSSAPPSNFPHAFLYTGDGTMTDLGTLPGGTYSEAFAISDDGSVVGFGSTADSPAHAFLYQDGQMTDLGTLGGLQSQALAINSADQVVGFAWDANGANRGFLWDGGTMTDLNSLIDPNAPYIITNATGINDSGQIVGYGYVLPDYDIHAFLLTPDSDGGARTGENLNPLPTESAAAMPRGAFPAGLASESRPAAQVVVRWEVSPAAGHSGQLDSRAHPALRASGTPGPADGATSLFGTDNPLGPLAQS